MIERLFKNIKTTFVGGIIFSTGTLLVAFGQAALSELGAFIGVAFALFFSKDPKSTNTK